ncbi:unnamed protein product [Prorocentrum cordatum]|uniref:K Homology domain-containing protein n=1 Tax=Prorocentrum cordatum TaxID=2364126 RepID=A0ABN9QJ41_9DINO|nr:unnamed protein product [Polarella glacialis]
MQAMLGMNYLMWPGGGWPLPYMGGQPGIPPGGMAPGALAFPGYGWRGDHSEEGHGRDRELGGYDPTSIVHIPRKHLGKVIGKQGATIKGIREMSGAKVHLNAEDKEATGPTCRLRVSGTPEQVERAKAMIAEVTQSVVRSTRPSDDRSRSRDRGGGGWAGLDSQHEGPITSIEVEQTFMGRIIGRQGTNINRLRKASGAVITSSKLSEDRTVLKISGSEDAVEKATTEIKDLIERSRQELEDGVSAPDEHGGIEAKGAKNVTYPAAIAGGIIGVKGAKIKEVRDTTGARIHVNVVDGRTEVKITGREDAIAKAEAAINAMAEEALEALKTAASEENKAKGSCDEDGKEPAKGKGADGDGQEGSTRLTLEFLSSAFGSIVGTGGSKIQDIRNQSGARVHVEKVEGEDLCKVHIIGRRGQVQQARALVESMAADPEAQPSRGSQPRREHGGKGGKGGKGKAKGAGHEEVTIPIPKSVLGRVIGKAGANIKSMKQDSGALMRITSQDTDPCPLRITGSWEQIRTAKALLRDLLEDTGVELPELSAPLACGAVDPWWPDQGGYPGYPMGGLGGPMGYGGPMGGLPGGFGPYGMPGYGPWGLEPPPGVVRGRSRGRDPLQEHPGGRRSRGRGGSSSVAKALPAGAPETASAEPEIDLDEL